MTKYLRVETLNKDGGVVKKVIHNGVIDGREDSVPLPGQRIVLWYEARLENGDIVDRSEEHAKKMGGEFAITVGMGEVIDGWDLGLMTMSLGEKCDIVIKSKYAFGDKGIPPKIPGGATVIFRVELLQIADRKCPKLDRLKRPDETLIKEAQMQKNMGNQEFKAKKYNDAAEFYRDGI